MEMTTMAKHVCERESVWLFDTFLGLSFSFVSSLASICQVAMVVKTVEWISESE